MSKPLILAGRVVLLLVVAALTGVAVLIASALIGHEVLVRIYGENLAPIDDTPPMVVAVWTSYLAAGLSALLVVALGWQRFIRR